MNIYSNALTTNGLIVRKQRNRHNAKENIINISKRGIIAILILCTLLGISGTSVYAATIVWETTVTTEEPTQELMPMIAKGCSSVPGSAYSMYSYIINGNDPRIYTYHLCVAYDPALYPRP